MSWADLIGGLVGVALVMRAASVIVFAIWQVV